jgi:Na+/H+ antiporter NhaA
MSLFIGSLAFLENDLAFTQVKIAVLVASFLSAILGIMVSYLATTKST